MTAVLAAAPTIPGPRTEPRPVVVPAPMPALPVATVDDLPWCTCLAPLDGTRPHYRHCDLRGGI